MSGSGEHGKRPVPGQVATGNPREEENQEPSAEAEVVALSPRTLMAPTRFVCDVCGQGFLREHQNLLLHRREHAGAHGERHGSFSDVISSVHRKERDSFVKHRSFCDPVVPFMNVDSAASALHRLALPSKAGDRGSASGFGMGTDNLNLWTPTVRAGGGGFIGVPSERGNGRSGCVAGACTRPELPPRGSLSRPVLLAAARAHAVAYQHACERCREFLKEINNGW